MPDQVTIRPKGGVRIPMPPGYGLPPGAVLPNDGLTVMSDPFIARLLLDEDAELVPDPAAKPATKAAPAAPAASQGA